MATRASTRNKPNVKDDDNAKGDESLPLQMEDEFDPKVEDPDHTYDDEELFDDEEQGDEDEAGEKGGDGEADSKGVKHHVENSQQHKNAIAANKLVSDLDIDKLKIEDILKLKITLEDGSQNFLFSRGPKYSEDRWPINCHLCRLGNIFTEDNLKHHIKGKSHQFKLTKRAPLVKYYSEPFYQAIIKNTDNDNEKPIKIYPGEIIEELTGDYEDRIIKKEEFQVKLPDDENIIKQLEKEPMHDYNTKLPLMGLCYVYKMMGFQGVTYFCTLCNLKIKEEAFQHIVGSEHQFKYINRHFPKFYEKVFSELKQVRGIDVRFCIRNVFRKLYRKIENIKGYRKVTICDDQDFFKNRKKFLLKTRFDEHYGEDTIMITAQEIDVLIRKCTNGMQFIKPDFISLANPQLGLRLTYQDEKNGQQMREDNNDYGGYRGGASSGSNSGNNNYSWGNYHQVISGEVDDLNQEYRNYDRFPRKHPKYEGEFNKFNSFKKEGADKDKKEFNMPWTTYWKRRLRVLYENDLMKRKQRIKKAFGLRLNVRTPSPSRSRWNNHGSNPMMMGNNNNNYGGGGYNHGYGNSGGGYNDYYGNNQNAAVAGLRDVMLAMMQNTVQNTGGGHGYGGNLIGGGGRGVGGHGSNRANNNSQSHHHQQQQLSSNLPPVASEPLGVISVLRLFNALENQLGSLGPQAVQLLSRAVLVEKNDQNPNDLMMEKDFYIFFATAREKLKGQYFANMIESNLLGPVKKTIQDSTTLMEMFEDYCKRTGKNIPNVEAFSRTNSTGNNWKSTNTSGGNSSAGVSGNTGTRSNTDNIKGGNSGGYYKAENNTNDNSGGSGSFAKAENNDDSRQFGNDDFFMGGQNNTNPGYSSASGSGGGGGGGGTGYLGSGGKRYSANNNVAEGVGGGRSGYSDNNAAGGAGTGYSGNAATTSGNSGYSGNNSGYNTGGGGYSSKNMTGTSMGGYSGNNNGGRTSYSGGNNSGGFSGAGNNTGGSRSGFSVGGNSPGASGGGYSGAVHSATVSGGVGYSGLGTGASYSGTSVGGGGYGGNGSGGYSVANTDTGGGYSSGNTAGGSGRYSGNNSGGFSANAGDDFGNNGNYGNHSGNFGNNGGGGGNGQYNARPQTRGRTNAY